MAQFSDQSGPGDNAEWNAESQQDTRHHIHRSYMILVQAIKTLEAENHTPVCKTLNQCTDQTDAGAEHDRPSPTELLVHPWNKRKRTNGTEGVRGGQKAFEIGFDFVDRDTIFEFAGWLSKD